MTTMTIDGFTLREGRHPAGSSLAWHRHAGPTICFVYAGGFTEQFAGAMLECTPGTLKITPGEEAHCNRFGGEDTRGLLVEVAPVAMDRLGSHGAPLRDRASYRDEHLALLAWRLAAELRRSDSAAPLAVAGLVLELLAGAGRGREVRLRGAAPRWLREARDYLHGGGRIGGLGDLAAAVGVHPATLARGFRKAYGCSVGAYLRRLRLSSAARELVATDAALAEIALTAGFADQSHFSNAFRRETGLSPLAFRRAARG